MKNVHKQNDLKISAICLGAASLGSQFIIMRQYLTVFYGNELSIGLTLALWLFWVGIGSWIGQKVWSKFNPSIDIFIFLLFIALLISTFSLAQIKLVRIILSIPFGEFVSFYHFLFFSLFNLSLPCLFYGFLFSLLSALAARVKDTGEPSAFIYALEAVGTMIAGLILTQIVHYFSNFLSIILLQILIFGLLFWRSCKKWLLAVFSLYLIILLFGIPQKWESKLQYQYWHSVDENMELKEWQGTRFGEVCILEWGEEYYYYFNGIKGGALSDSIENQSLAAILMNMHQNPKDILLVGGSFSGLALELGKYSNTKVTVLEIDEKAKRFLENFNGKYHGDEKNKNGHYLFLDARYYTQKTDQKYDLIIVNVGKPSSALTNRYYTYEFFTACKNCLKKDGLFAICNFPGGENYMGNELQNLNSSLYSTLTKVFDNVRIIPGDVLTYFAGENPSFMSSNAETLSRRLEKRAIDYKYFYPEMFRHILNSEREEFVKQQITKNSLCRINYDFTPVSYLFDFMLWNKILGNKTRFTKELLHIPFFILNLPLAIIFIVIFLVCSFTKFSFLKTFEILFVVAITGFCGMVFHLILILAFQTLFGYIYTWLGIVMAFYMGGMAAMGWLVNEKLDKLIISKAIIKVLFFILITSLLLQFVLRFFSKMHSPALYLIVIIWAGGLFGSIFPLFCRLYKRVRQKSNFGSIYAADLFGGAAGALVICGILIPLYGLIKILLFVSLLTSLCILFLWKLNHQLKNKSL